MEPTNSNYPRQTSDQSSEQPMSGSTPPVAPPPPQPIGGGENLSQPQDTSNYQSPSQLISPIQSTAGQPQPTDSGSMPVMKRGGMGKWLLLLVIIVVVIGVIFVIMSMLKKGNTSPSAATGSSYQSAETAQLNTLSQKGGSLSASDVASLNATDLFYAVFRRAAEQQSFTTEQDFYETQNENDVPSTTGEVVQLGYNYKTKAYAYQDSKGGASNFTLNRCIGSKDYAYQVIGSSVFPWTHAPTSDTNCSPTTVAAIVNDGLNTGGLTDTQAQTFVDAIRNTKGLVTVKKASLASQQGKNYLRFDVTINQLGTGSNMQGIGYVEKAFASLGIDS
jgi:hypothetical protein